MPPEKPRRLGRGLEALLTAKAAASPTGATATAEPATQGETLRNLPVADIRPNPYQPRKEFRPEELEELKSSLRASGLLQPITVRKSQSGGGYELIAGERRLRAATALGWTEIPAVIKEIDDTTLLTLALVENLQRADLNPLEEAEGYQRLIDEFSLTQQQVGEVVGKDRTTVANMLRVLKLPASVRRLLQDGQLTLGHARALLAFDSEHTMVEMAKEIVANGLNVRDVERRARDSAPASKQQRTVKGAVATNATRSEARRIAEELRRHLQTDVSIAVGAGERGKIEISFYSAEDLERVLDLILGAKRERL
ncbi:MAG TPA: ParB/RepB/Spo0J family partition protein [Gemmatimonadaceae bacterium]|nr:ParB/RepB/Spo0J family partition protein [Gemmatimonadaceae bacterium]